jgi:tyrosyl-tRNA synthetase
MVKNIYEELTWRGLFYQQSNPEGIEKLLSSGTQNIYAGFDPTAESFHIGNLVPLMGLRRLQLAGHCPIALVGGATGLIGDPSGKCTERALYENDVVAQWSVIFKTQIEKIIDFSAGKHQAKLVNNYSWIGSLTTIEYLREIGKHFTVNWMVAKDSVRSRFEGEDGISYTEFSYMILQAFDFLHLAEKHNCKLQVGGSDQWGNMIAGIELIRKKLSMEVHAATFPLIMTASGKKFGKSEGGAIWVDAQKTSPYEFYQYWINTDDRDVIKFLKYFTFLDASEIEALEKATATSPEERQAHKKLAYEMTEMIHGKEEVSKVIKTSEALFGKGNFTEVDLKTLQNILSSAPTVELENAEKIPDILELAVKTKLCASKSEVRKTITSGGLYINNERINSIEYQPKASDFISGNFLVLRKGKKNYAIVKLQR